MEQKPASALLRLLEIMRRLRDPEYGCRWDLEQDFASIAPFTIEEAYEVDDAIRRGDMEDLRGELGDLLLQVVFHAQMADEQGLFGFDDVARDIGEKLVRRHPHVFAAPENRPAAAVRDAWEHEKARERAERARARVSAEGGETRPSEQDSLFDGIPAALPALMRAHKLQSRAARAGQGAGVSAPELTELVSRLCELSARRDGAPPADADSAVQDLGRLLFATVTLARALDVDAETALREFCTLFERQVQQQLDRSD